MAEASIPRPSLEELRQAVRALQINLSDADLERLYPDIAGNLASLWQLRQIELGETEPASIYHPEGGPR